MLPLQNISGVSAISGTFPVKGNNKCLGLTNGTKTAGMGVSSSNDLYGADCYGSTVGSTSGTTILKSGAGAIGVTTSASNSGLVASPFGYTIGTISSLQLGNWYIKF